MMNADNPDLKRTQAALQDSEERLRAVLLHMPAAIFIVQAPDGRVTFKNDLVDEVLGPTGAGAEAPDGTPLGWAIHEDGRPYDLREYPSRRALFYGETVRGQPMQFRRADGTMIDLEMHAGPVRNTSGDIIAAVAVALDVSERARAEARLQALNATLEQQVHERTAELMAAEESLRQSQKMEAVGQLTGGLAHDFNNLLTGISGSLEMLEKRLAQGRFTELDGHLHTAQGAVKRAAALTHRLLAFSRRQTLDPKPTGVNHLIAGLEELIRRTAGPAVTVTCAAAPELHVLADPHQLENALLNLCINARDAMPNGGSLTIESAAETVDASAAKTLELEPGRYVALSVADTGSGMTPDIIARAFDPFFTTKPLGEGTGLGLSMVYGFARQSGGQARIASEPGRGTRVTLLLPRVSGAPEGADAPPETPAAQQAGGETVLVVDDEPTVRMLVREVLDELGYQILEAEDGNAGLAFLRGDSRIDLLVTDVGLPGGLNGRQLADAALALRPDLKILFITGYAEHSVTGEAHLEPNMALLIKPFSLDHLARRIHEIIAGK